MKRTAALLVTLSFAAGCATSDPETRSAGEGAGIGAAVGAIGCALAKCKGEDYAKVMAVTAAVGAGIGYSLASNITKEKQKLAGKENDLDARIRYARALNDNTAKFNAELGKQLVSIEQQINQSSASKQRLVQIRQDLDTKVADANSQLAVADKELADMQRFRAQPSTKQSNQLDGEIERLKGLLAEAHGNTTALASLRQRT